MKKYLSSRLKKALALHQAGKVLIVEKLYRKLLLKEPKNVDLQHLLGILLGQQKRYVEALSCLQTALALDPNSASIHNSLGNVQKYLGNIDEAIFHYQSALNTKEASSAVYNNLGILWQRKNEWPKAEECYKKAILLRPNYADAYYNFSTLLTLQQKFDEAIGQLALALEHEWHHAQAHTHIAQLLLQQQKPGEAIAHCQQRLLLEPNHVETHHQLAVALTQQNRWEEAIVHYEHTLVLNPNHEEALHNLGALYVVRRKPELALGCYLKRLALSPDFDAYYNVGVIYLYQDRHQDAIHYLKTALQLEPNALNVYINLGAVYLKKEEFAEAIFYYESALRLSPQDAELNYILAALSNSKAPNLAPESYVKNLFDQYAPYFDRHLDYYLNYQVPQLLLKAVQNISGGCMPEFKKALDLGCGTGLCGVLFRPYVKNFIGIDLSENMLAIAKDKNIYDQIQISDINAALSNYIAINLVIAGDVFGYIGDLNQTFLLVSQALDPNGLFIYTTEKTWEADFKLQNNARFAHHPNYITQLATCYHLSILQAENAILRTQKGQSVMGMVWVMQLITLSNNKSH